VNLGRNQLSTAVQTQQPKTSLNDAFKLLECCEALRDNETHRRGSQRYGATEGWNAQKKKLSDRQKVDKRSAWLSAVDYVTEFQKLTSTSTATANTGDFSGDGALTPSRAAVIIRKSG